MIFSKNLYIDLLFAKRLSYPDLKVGLLLVGVTLANFILL